MKTVEYLGNTYEVEDWANFIAADGNGNVHAYSEEPLWRGVQWIPQRAGLDWQQIYPINVIERPPLKAI